MHDLYHNVLVSQHLNPVVATTTKTSTSIDMQGYAAANVMFSLGTAGDTLSGSLYWTLKLQHSDTDSGYADVASTDVVGGATSIVVDALSKDETVYVVGYIGGKRYVKAVATPTGSHSTGTPIGMLAARGKAAYSPVV